MGQSPAFILLLLLLVFSASLSPTARIGCMAGECQSGTNQYTTTHCTPTYLRRGSSSQTRRFITVVSVLFAAPRPRMRAMPCNNGEISMRHPNCPGRYPSAAQNIPARPAVLDSDPGRGSYGVA